MSENKILEIRHLSKDFGSHKVLRDIDFLVHPGDVHESYRIYKKDRRQE